MWASLPFKSPATLERKAGLQMSPKGNKKEIGNRSQPIGNSNTNTNRKEDDKWETIKTRKHGKVGAKRKWWVLA